MLFVLRRYRAPKRRHHGHRLLPLGPQFPGDERVQRPGYEDQLGWGQTWGEEQIIYKGSNWEPQILQLPDGEIQVYFTHGGPKIQPQMEAGIPTSQMVPSSGTAIIRSKDNGKPGILT